MDVCNRPKVGVLCFYHPGLRHLANNELASVPPARWGRVHTLSFLRHVTLFYHENYRFYSFYAEGNRCVRFLSSHRSVRCVLAAIAVVILFLPKASPLCPCATVVQFSHRCALRVLPLCSPWLNSMPKAFPLSLRLNIFFHF